MPAALLSAKELWEVHEQVQRSRLTLGSSEQHLAGGWHRSSARGSGLELEDIRNYQPGDDMRHIHWRVTARANAPMTKVFREERQNEILLLVDRGPTMHFGTRKELKATTAARAAAMLAFAAMQGRDRVAGMIWEATGTAVFPPATTPENILPLLHAAAAPLPEKNPNYSWNRGGWQQQLQCLTPRTRHIFLISDFYHLDEAQSKLLRALAERARIVAIQVLDPAEEQLAAGGRMRFTSPHTGRTGVIDTDDPKLRESYQRARAERLNTISQLLAAARVTQLRMYTNQDTLQALSPVISSHG